MKVGILSLCLTLVAGLLVFSQGMAAEQGKMMGGALGDAAQSGMKAMDEMKSMDPMQTQQQSASLELNPVQTSEMQRLLNQEGYEMVNVNGIIDQETMAAIRLFQDSERLTVTGTPNQETLRALAPNTEQQEFFGLAPEFGETE